MSTHQNIKVLNKNELIKNILDNMLQNLRNIGLFILYIADVFQQALKRPFRIKLILQHMEIIGNKSLNIIILTGLATGTVFGLQVGGIFKFFGAEGLIGGATGIALATELAPLVTGFILAGRTGSAMSAEISIMKVTEQIAALEAMGVYPIHYLVVPRVIASILIMPFLCGIFMFVGTLGVYFIGAFLYHVDQGVFYEKLVDLVGVKDVFFGLRKMFIFSFVISLVGCREGLQASKGAEGVGIATTSAVVKSLILILMSDFIMSFIEIRWLS